MEDDLQFLGTRRRFIRQAACATMGVLGATSAIRDLRLINSAAAQITLSDYRALVCIFLNGGNDSNNLVIPTAASEYNTYVSIRQNLAVPSASLHTINPSNNDGHSYGLHPSCGKMKDLFEAGKLALLFNTGVLSYPLTRAQYQSGVLPKPPQLFSHSDQVTQWQTSIPDQPPKTGWGGRIADLLHPQQIEIINDVPTPASAQIALCTSLAGANTFEVGSSMQQYHVSTGGAVTLNNVTGARLTTLRSLLGVPSVNLQQEVYGQVMEKAMATGDTLNNAITATSSAGYWNLQFPNTGLGQQLRMVARMIAGRNTLNMKRQIFFCSVGGYDTHTLQVGTNATTGNPDATTGIHANLLNEVSEAVWAFQNAIEQLAAAPGGDPALSTKVTAFSASDFGRTFPTNGQGSDHGWGSHHFIVGGGVRGKRTYGTFPIHQINGPDDTSTGRWIPRISVDEYSATLAKWFGVTGSNLQTIFPNLGRFSTPDLGFMI